MASNDHHDKPKCLDIDIVLWVNSGDSNYRNNLANQAIGRLFLYGLLVIATTASVGCNSLIDSRVPELIQQRVDPQLGRSYLLYLPSGYDNKRSWPLIVVCHSSFTDSPNRQIRAWTELAESKGFIVVAPTLESVSGGLGRRAADLSARLQNDETHILSVVKHVRAGHNVSADRILISGRGKGGLVAVHVGLRQPNVFRAIAVTQPAFDTQFLATTSQWIDHHQPIRVHYNAESALWGDQPADCVEWLRQHGADVRADPLGSARIADPTHAVQFFERVIREEPWVRIESQQAKGHGALARKFTLHTVLAPETVRWAFGDGDESLIENPLHVYKKAGRYQVTAILRNKNTVLERKLEVAVP